MVLHMAAHMDTYQPPIRISEAARLLGVHRDTIRRWVEEGKLDAIRLPGGEVRYRREDIVGMLKANG